MSIPKRLAAGITSSVWSAAIGFLAVPFYLKLLGTEAYGLIGLFASIQAIAQILDLGLTPTISREVARSTSIHDRAELSNLFKSATTIYWILALALFVFITLMAENTATHWINNNELSKEDVAQAISIMGLVLALRWPNSIYSGALVGANKQGLLALISIVSTTTSSLGAILWLWLYQPTIQVFFIWQAVCAGAFVLVYRHFAWTSLGGSGQAKFSVQALKKIWRFSAGMNGIALTSLALNQVDKVVLSKLLDLRDFGYYTIAVQISSTAYLLLTPLFNVIYPKISELAARDSWEELTQFYRRGTRMLVYSLTPGTLAVSVNAIPLILLWTGDASVAQSAGPIASVFIIGATFNGIMHFPYALQLATGNPGISLKINCILVAMVTPLIVYLSSNYGALGGAYSWAIVNITYLFIGTYFTHKIILPHQGFNWLLKDVLLSLAIVCCALTPTLFFVTKIFENPLLQVLSSATIALVFIFLAVGRQLKSLTSKAKVKNEF